MRKALLIFLFIAAFKASADGTFGNSQFEIEALGGGDSSKASQPVLMSLPPKNNFSPNINVQIQIFPGTLKQYLNITKSQIESFGWALLESSIEGDKLTLEYQGSLQGKSMHWFQEAVKSKGKIYLITATGLERDWNSYSSDLIESVRSFRLK